MSECARNVRSAMDQLISTSPRVIPISTIFFLFLSPSRIAASRNLGVVLREISGEDFLVDFLLPRIPVLMREGAHTWPIYQGLKNGGKLGVSESAPTQINVSDLIKSKIKSGAFVTQGSIPGLTFEIEVSNKDPDLQSLIFLPLPIVSCQQLLEAFQKIGKVLLVGSNPGQLKLQRDVTKHHLLVVLLEGEAILSHSDHLRTEVNPGDLFYLPPDSESQLATRFTRYSVLAIFLWKKNQNFDPTHCDARSPLYDMTNDVEQEEASHVFTDHTLPDLVLNTGFKIPPIGLGTGRLFEKTYVTIKTALTLGYRLFDTAPSYSGEETREEFVVSSEHEIGRALSNSEIPRSELFLVTKIAPDSMTYNRTISSVTQSMSQLKTSYIDAVLIHDFSDNEDPKSPSSPWISWRALEELQERGLVRSIGVSNINGKDLSLLLLSFARRPPSIVQNWFDPFHRDDRVREICRRHDVIYMGYSTLGAAWSGEESFGFDINPVLAHDVIKEAASSVDLPTSSFVLRWAMEKNVVVIPCSRDPGHLDRNLQARHLLSTEPHAAQSLDQLDNLLGNPELVEWRKSSYSDIWGEDNSEKDEL